ncbi:MAG: glutamine-hydrolyzing GMP synthase [bacterium]
MNKDKIAVLDFGGQYAHLIANRIRRLGVYTEILPPDTSFKSLKGFKGVIFSGGPHSVYEDNVPFNKDILKFNKPILGLCYGHQLICHTLGGHVEASDKREYGTAEIDILKKTSLLFGGLGLKEKVWMSHGDSVNKLPPGFEKTAGSRDCEFAAVEDSGKNIFGLQFHPEVFHTQNGNTILDNFIKICSCKKTWNMRTYLEELKESIKQKVGKRNVFLLVSGGVDSTVCFSLLNEILGENRVVGFHIDTGLMRKNETSEISDYLAKAGFNNLRVIDASRTFLEKLDGVTDPEKKRKIMGDTFIQVQQQGVENMGLDPELWMLGQGTIYPDTIESGGTKHADKIKTHHNRVDIIEELIKQGKVIEPLAQLYKDEVRALGVSLKIPEHLVWRHPFPGPGLGVRILCSNGKIDNNFNSINKKASDIASISGLSLQVLPIRSVGVQGDSRTYAHPALLTGEAEWDSLEKVSTEVTNNIREINRVIYQIAPKIQVNFKLHELCITKERIALLQEADVQIHDLIRDLGFYRKIWQMPVALLPLCDNKNSECLVMRPVHSQEAMTASFFPLPMQELREFGNKLLKDLPVAALFYDITHKPPGTIEWE